MSSLAQVGNPLPDILQHSTLPSFTATSNQFHARSQSLSSANFTFVTSEGDRVSLSSASEVNTSFGTYTFQGLSNDRSVSVQGQHVSTSSQKHFNLLVEGDLNEQEHADIQAFLQSAHTILQALQHDNTEEATHAVASLAKLETLSHAALFVRQSTTASLATQSTRVAIPGKIGSHEHEGVREQANLQRINSLEHIVGRLQKVRENVQISPEQLRNQFPTIVTTLLTSLADNPEPTNSPPTLVEQLQKQFLESLLEAVEHDVLSQTPSPLTEQSNVKNQGPLFNGETTPHTASPHPERPRTPLSLSA
ncbi:MAG: hypothetical protein NPIRA02_05990 [Nitrospirales bacterium]|nr:MAG: hypothetical protein NPIRA02_05990 [Nitrospirales bacterium]